MTDMPPARSAPSILPSQLRIQVQRPMRGHALDLWQEHEQIADSIEIFSRALDPVLVNLSHSQTPHRTPVMHLHLKCLYCRLCKPPVTWRWSGLMIRQGWRMLGLPTSHNIHASRRLPRCCNIQRRQQRDFRQPLLSWEIRLCGVLKFLSQSSEIFVRLLVRMANGCG
jgi:hypothetical protein